MLAAGGGGGAAAAAPPPLPANSPYNHLDTLVLPGLTVRMILGIMMCAVTGRATLETLVDAGYTLAGLLVLAAASQNPFNPGAPSPTINGNVHAGAKAAVVAHVAGRILNLLQAW
jgi:hypothetical protein